MVSRSKPPLLQLGGEQRLLDEGQVGPRAVFLALGHDQLLIGQRLDDGPNRASKLGKRAKPAAAIGDLVTAFPVGMGPHQHGHLLAVLADRCHQHLMGLFGAAQAIADERGFDERRR